MRLIFMDESGFSFGDWRADIENQPFYVVSAICIPCEGYYEACNKIRNAIAEIGFPKKSKPLGQGFEIKARSIARGKGWWESHNEERNIVRDLMLSFPAKYDGTGFVVVIDKEAHRKKYIRPYNPFKQSLQFIFERIQKCLSEDFDDYGYCIYDQNTRLESGIQNYLTKLKRKGSKILRWIYGDLDSYILKIDRILELAFGKSENSIGLQVADFFATHTNFYYKQGKPSPCEWWDTLILSLHRKGNRLKGIGLKEFP